MQIINRGGSFYRVEMLAILICLPMLCEQRRIFDLNEIKGIPRFGTNTKPLTSWLK
jgi:hypothetical protein